MQGLGIGVQGVGIKDLGFRVERVGKMENQREET